MTQDLEERLGKIELQLGIFKSRLINELGGEGSTGNINKTLQKVQKDVEQIKEVLLGNGKLGLISMVRIMWATYIFILVAISGQSIALIKLIFFNE